MGAIKKARIIEKKLGRQNAWGLYGDGLIEIDPRQRSKRYLITCIHELLHHALPEFSEYKVDKISRVLANGVWEQNFRRIMK